MAALQFIAANEEYQLEKARNGKHFVPSAGVMGLGLKAGVTECDQCGFALAQVHSKVSSLVCHTQQWLHIASHWLQGPSKGGQSGGGCKSFREEAAAEDGT